MNLKKNKKAIFLLMLVLGSFATSTASADKARGLPNIQLDYLTQLHSKAEIVDPSLTAMLVANFIEANQVATGMQIFAELEKTGNKESETLYKTAHAVLRASYASEVFLLQRSSWVKDTISMFDESRESEPDNLLIRWLIGTTLAKLPAMFDQRENAMTDLQWVRARFDQLPKDGLLNGAQREVYYELACLYRIANDSANAKRYLELSGYTSFDREYRLDSQFAASAERGLTLSLPEIVEVVPERVFAVSGFEMTEFYFIVTADGTQTISIDAGTRPDTAKAAHEAIIDTFPSLPPISTVLVTHSHWDHVGGHQYFRDLNPDVQFISNADYENELMIVRTSEPRYKYFFSNSYTDKNVASYKPDQTIAEEGELLIGGTKILATAVKGGETNDAMFFHFPELEVTFVGDFIMPYIGAPFANEGNPQGLLQSIDILRDYENSKLLHGHRPLTDVFAPASLLIELGDALHWLNEGVRTGIKFGLDLSELRQLNLIPESVISNPEIQLAYMVIRNGFLTRLHHQSGGYWTANLGGMLDLSEDNIGFMLSEYLGISEQKLVKAVKQMLSDGHPEAALKMVRWGLTSHKNSSKLLKLQRQALITLRSRAQFTDPFKLVIYSEMLGEGVSQLVPE